jgi:glyoxylase-like metal-dependent hydrolase (beta-lactamase superfamily II)
VTVLELPGHDVLGIRAANPGPFTLTGTNSWIVGRDPAWLIDPGPRLEEHVRALLDELEARGGLGGIALTHDHHDHTEALPAIRERFPQAPVAGVRGAVDVPLEDGYRFGPFETFRTPGHAPDHVSFLVGELGFAGDAVLGTGSVFIAPDPGALAAYLSALQRLRARALAFLCPGHGPIVRDVEAKLDEYIQHRLERERRLLAALDRGLRTPDELLAEVWDDVSPFLRPAAGVTLAAHLGKLEDEGRLPSGVQWPAPIPGLSYGTERS